MGMYTKLNIITKLKKDAKVNELFDKYMLHSSSYYFTGTSNTNYFKEENVIHIDCDFKNYNDEVEKIIKWLELNSGDDYNRFIGYSRYEETTNPTLYFINKGKISEYYNENIKEER